MSPSRLLQRKWQGEGWETKHGFDLAKRVLNSRVDEMLIDPMELSPERLGTWDVVFYCGILCHMRHPLLALERVASVTKGVLIVDTHLDLMFARRPAAAFYEDTEAGHDPTNWWGPNDAAVRAMLRAAGFNKIQRVYKLDLALCATRSIEVGVWRRRPGFEGPSCHIAVRPCGVPCVARREKSRGEKRVTILTALLLYLKFRILGENNAKYG